jgi:hypothetical protein
MQNWDCNKGYYIETPEKIKSFFNEIEDVCKKYGYSIGHEDGHGAFEIDKYCETNIKWLKDAHLRVNE